MQANHRESGMDVGSDFDVRLEKLLPDEKLRKGIRHLISQLDDDPMALIALKGHLVIEEELTRSIETYVLHPSKLEDARLSFAQKLAICRSISRNKDDSSVWGLIEKVNKLRNTLSHSLDGAPRAKAMKAIRSAYAAELGEKQDETNEIAILAGTMAVCMGFLIQIRSEMERDRERNADRDPAAALLSGEAL